MDRVDLHLAPQTKDIPLSKVIGLRIHAPIADRLAKIRSDHRVFYYRKWIMEGFRRDFGIDISKND